MAIQQARALGPLTIRLLGGLEVLRGDEPVPLPQSRKTRALLAYLVLSGRAHRRDHLCDLLWDVPDDVRGALRWSLSKLRAAVDDPGGPRIVTEGDHIRFARRGAAVDLLDLLDLRAALPREPRLASTELLLHAAGKLEGELLDGVDHPDFLEYQAFCVAERDRVRRLRVKVLRALVERLRDEPERALPHARALAQHEPLDAAAQASLLELLEGAGFGAEAELRRAAGVTALAAAGVDTSPLAAIAAPSTRAAAHAPRPPWHPASARWSRHFSPHVARRAGPGPGRSGRM